MSFLSWKLLWEAEVSKISSGLGWRYTDPVMDAKKFQNDLADAREDEGGGEVGMGVGEYTAVEEASV